MCLPPIIKAIRAHMVAKAADPTPFYIFKYDLLSADMTNAYEGKKLSKEQQISLKKYESTMKQALEKFLASEKLDIKPEAVTQTVFTASLYKNFISCFDEMSKRVFKKKAEKTKKKRIVWKSTEEKEITIEKIIRYLHETKNNEFIITNLDAFKNNKSDNFPNLWQNINAHRLTSSISRCISSAGAQIESNKKARSAKIKEEYSRFIDLFCKDFKAIFRTQNDIVIEACTYEAVLDLVTGNLHKLDPVIKDAGCQWRVPFIVDLYHAVMEHTEGKYKIEAIEEEYRKAWRALGNPDLVSFTHRQNGKILKATGEAGAAKLKTLKYIDISELKLFGPFYDDVSAFITKWNTEALETTPDGLRAHYLNAKYDNVQFMDANALDYLMICKALTINHIRTQDLFGLGGITVETSPPVTGSKFSELGGRLSWYSRAYMIHITKGLKIHTDKMSGVESDEEEEGLEGEATATTIETTMADTLVEVLSTPRWYFPFEASRILTHSFYEPLRLLFMYLYFKKIPLIIDLKRTICSGEKSPDYTFSGGGVYYFRPDHDLQKFIYVPEDKMKDSDRHNVGFCIDAFSMALKDQPLPGVKFSLEENYEKFLAEFLDQCDIIDQILVSAFPHPSCPNDTKYLKEMEGEDSEFTEVVSDTLTGLRKQASAVLNFTGKARDRSLTGPALALLGGDESFYGATWNIVDEVETLRSLCGKIGYDRVGYRTGSGETRTRIAGTVLFAPIHIYGCSFAIKKKEYDIFLKTKPDIVKGQMINFDNCKLMLS